MGRLFGTDGIRGVVNQGLDASLAYKVGLAAAQVLAGVKQGERPVISIGKDTRISCDLLKGALVAGLCTAGADVLDLGTIPTPGVAWATIHEGADAGIVISASHNSFEHNGIKIFDGSGFKLSDALEERIEDVVLNSSELVSRKTHGEIGRVRYIADRASEGYIAHLTKTVTSDFKGLRILVDCANGAASSTAARLFDRFPSLHTDVINADPDGVNINASCGSTHMDSLCAMVKAGGYDLGVAFDGDADRCLLVAEDGTLIDGDRIMAVCGLAFLNQGRLPGNTVVATVMSNLGLHAFAKAHDFTLECTDVGDRNVLERMVAGGFILGGEQSGHMIFLEHTTTGDGQLTALQFLDLLYKYGIPASQLLKEFQEYPQVLRNTKVASNEVKQQLMANPRLAAEIAHQESQLEGEGRILVRPSGTEALVRVMVEAKTAALANQVAGVLEALIQELM